MRLLLALVLLAPQVVFRVHDDRIDEASGIARGIRSPGVYYVQNDSGDTARFFALDAKTGRTAATITVPGADAIDWEDLAVARDAAGTPSVWLADIGDNDAKRDEIEIYRVDEPSVAGSDRDRSVESGRPDVWHLRYPDGPHNAESLAVRTGGTAFIVTKTDTGVSGVYRVPARPSDRMQTLQRIGTVRLTDSPLPLATGAALSAGGTLLAVRTYSDAYLWTVHGGDVAAALKTAPRHLDLPLQQQGEGIAIDGDRLILDSEGRNQPVYAIPIPAAATGSGTASPSPTSTPDGATSSRPGVGAVTHPAADNDQPGWVLPVGIAGAAAVLLVLAVVAAHVRRRHRAG